MADAFHTHREASLALLNSDFNLDAVEGCFLADIAVGRHSDRKAELQDWISGLLQRAGLPPLAEGGAE